MNHRIEEQVKDEKEKPKQLNGLHHLHVNISRDGMFISDHVGLKRLKGLVGVNGFNTSTD
jgi:hypothetical protein